MPLFMVNKESFNYYRFGKRDVELRSVKPQWKNSKAGDLATIQCGRNIFRKRITRIHKGTLARVFLKIDYQRMFPEALNILEAVRAARKIYPETEEFMAFELEEFM